MLAPAAVLPREGGGSGSSDIGGESAAAPRRQARFLLPRRMLYDVFFFSRAAIYFRGLSCCRGEATTPSVTQGRRALTSAAEPAASARAERLPPRADPR